MNIALVLEYMHPGRQEGWLVRDDGNGAYIAEWHLADSRPSIAEIEAVWNSADFQVWAKARKAALIDRDTGHEIDKALHPFAGVEQQIGIIRNQIVQIINALGLAPTDGFANFNEIAIAKIQDGEQKKEAL